MFLELCKFIYSQLMLSESSEHKRVVEIFISLLQQYIIISEVLIIS